jgi:hypothetical protein
MKKRISDALAQLQTVNEVAIRDAGPRYTPGLDPAAPNIEIGYLVDAFDALSLVDGWRGRAQGLAQGITKASEYQTHLLDRLFRRCRATPARLVEQVQALQGLHEPAALRRAAMQLRRNSERVVGRLQREVDALREQLRQLPDEPPNREQRSRLQSDVRALSSVMYAVQELVEYLDSPSGRFLRGDNGLLLLGSWGTGKTHLLCDIARQRLEAVAPALLVMASSLPRGIDVLDGVAATTGLAASGAELLSELNRLGAATNTRALLMVDAINEGSQEVWRDQLQSLARTVGQLAHVGLVVSCRRPFDEAIVTEQAARRLLSLEHYGFEDQEFDAQLEYFAFYDLPAPSVPLITPEFTRPLFLKVLCEALKDLGRQSQRRKLREIASGQKGMTYVLEYYTKKVGRGIERDLGLTRGGCWLALKGNQADAGLAGRMAAQGSDWLSTEEAIGSLEASLSLTRQQAEGVLRGFIHEGLLAASVRRHDSQVVTGVQFAYQRFGDHLIARHLLEAHLVTATEQAVRRCFYRNRPLGRPFRLDRWGRQFENPGIAAALMLEFPERMKRSPLSHELLSYLPKATRRVGPVKDVFLDGLYWRSADAFTGDTDRLVSFFLTQVDDWTRDETFEVLVGLATRPTHPYSATRLADYLGGQTMASRDQTWSEYLRRSDEQGNVQRILAWVERSTEQDESDVRNEIRLLSLFLTTTNRPLRDRATRALVVRSSARPDVLFDEVLQSLAFSDPYVPERMLAAAYGVAMRLWADPDGGSLSTAIVPFARSLVRQVFVPNAPHATKHVLRRDYALGVIALARRINPRAIASQQVALLNPPFPQIPSPFVDPAQISDADVEDSRRAMHMDFATTRSGDSSRTEVTTKTRTRSIRRCDGRSLDACPILATRQRSLTSIAQSPKCNHSAANLTGAKLIATARSTRGSLSSRCTEFGAISISSASGALGSDRRIVILTRASRSHRRSGCRCSPTSSRTRRPITASGSPRAPFPSINTYSFFRGSMAWQAARGYFSMVSSSSPALVTARRSPSFAVCSCGRRTSPRLRRRCPRWTTSETHAFQSQVPTTTPMLARSPGRPSAGAIFVSRAAGLGATCHRCLSGSAAVAG